MKMSFQIKRKPSKGGWPLTKLGSFVNKNWKPKRAKSLREFNR